MRSLWFVPLMAAVASCGSEAPIAHQEDLNASSPAIEQFARAPREATAAAKADLESWSMVLEVMHDPELTVPWVVGVADDGTPRFGLAETVCATLREYGAVDEQTTVRIVDRAEVIASQGDFRAASLGHVDCDTGANLGI
ncbi:MAG: hypothetical protein AAGE86_03950 [Pseudomonadota bacterium]